MARACKMRRSGRSKLTHSTDKCTFWPPLAGNKKEVLFMAACYLESRLWFGILFSECGCKEAWVFMPAWFSKWSVDFILMLNSSAINNKSNTYHRRFATPWIFHMKRVLFWGFFVFFVGVLIIPEWTQKVPLVGGVSYTLGSSQADGTAKGIFCLGHGSSWLSTVLALFRAGLNGGKMLNVG